MIHQSLASVIDVVDLVGEVAKVTTTVVVLWVPVMSKLNLSAFIALRRQEYQCKAPLFTVVPLQLGQTERLAIKGQRRVNVSDSDHGVQILHSYPLYCLNSVA